MSLGKVDHAKQRWGTQEGKIKFIAEHTRGRPRESKVETIKVSERRRRASSPPPPPGRSTWPISRPKGPEIYRVDRPGGGEGRGPVFLFLARTPSADRRVQASPGKGAGLSYLPSVLRFTVCGVGSRAREAWPPGIAGEDNARVVAPRHLLGGIEPLRWADAWW